MTPFMTETERWRQAMLKGTMSPGMTPGMGPSRQQAIRDSAQDFSGQERGIERKQAMAAQLMRGQAPQGRTVGPYDVYMGPNIGESIAHAAGQLGGAYLMRQAGKEDAALDEAREKVALSKAMLADDDVQYERGRDATKDEQWQKTFDRQQEWRDEGRANKLADEAASHQREKELAQLESSLEGAEGADLKDVRDYSRDIQKAGIPSTRNAMTELNSTIDQFRGEDGKIKGDLPGVGGVENVKLVGDVWTAVKDAAAGDTDRPSGKAVKQAVNKVLNQVIKDESGATVTVQEMVRQKLGAGFDIFASDEDLLRGLEVIDKAITASEKNIASGYGPNVYDTYNKNKEAIFGTDEGEAPKEKEAKPEGEYTEGTVIVNPKTGHKMRWENGKWVPI